MKFISLEELKKIELSILEEVHKVCVEEGFRYSLAGGTMIGAIRHKGFIPWDDDIDILMPRPDYKKLIRYCQTHETNFDLLCNETNEKYAYLFAKAMAKNTVIYEENGNRSNINLGVYIDIFPVDGLGNSYREAIRKYMYYSIEREILVAYNWKNYFRSKTHSIILEPVRIIFYLLSRFFDCRKTIEKIQKYYEKTEIDDVRISGSIAGVYRNNEIVNTEVYTDLTDIYFEGKIFKAMKRYDTYLHKLYGNYMQLPPENKRQSHHNFKAYYLEVGERANDDLFKQ